MKIKKEKNLPKFELADIGAIPNSIGIVVVSQLYMVRENRTVLEGKVIAAGLDWKCFLEKRKQSAFLDALQSMEDGGLIRKAENKYDSITYQVCGEALEKALQEGGFPELVIGKKASVRFFKPGRGPKEGTIESDPPEIASAVTALALIEQDIVRTSDITGALKRIIKAEADTIPLNNSGTTWFLAPQFVPLAEKLEKLINSLQGFNQFFFFPVAGEEKTKANIWTAFSEDIKRKIKDLNKSGDEVARVIADGEGDAKGRLETVKKGFASEKERILGYAELLQQSSEFLLSSIEKAKNDILVKTALQ